MIQSPKVRLGAALIAAVILTGILGGMASAAPAQKNPTVLDQLRQKAWSEGSVRVLVRFQVPELETLTTASAKYGTADSSPAVTRARTAADVALNRAIEYASWKIVTEIQGTDYEETGRFHYIPYIGLKVSPNALAVLEASPDVVSITEDKPRKLIDPEEARSETSKGGGEPNRPDGADLPLLNESTSLVQAKALWDIGITGNGWYVAILDTGIRTSHQFFSGKNIIEACRARGRDGNSGAGDCPNGLSEQNGPNTAAHYASSYSGFDHGTHVAGIAAGNYGTMSGVAKGANIIAVQVFSRFTPTDCGGSACVMSWDSDQSAGMEYVYSLRGSYNIAAVNMSIGGGGEGSFCDGESQKSAIDLLRSAGIATAIATGNDGYCYGVSVPGCISSSVSVGSTDKSDNESNFNNWHPSVQRLFAPGQSIRSSTGDSDSSYENWNGTSMATPHVTGAWALMKQVIPGGNVGLFLNALRNTGRAIYSVCDGYSQGIPRIKILDAITSLTSYTLVIQASTFGSTTPVPGTYHYPPNSTVTVTAVPALYSVFTEWVGDASGSANPLSVLISRDKTVRANFRYIFAPEASGVRILNRSFSQAEYINKLSWENPSSNAGLNVTGYRIYLMDGGSGTLLAEVGPEIREYSHRMAGENPQTYHIAAIVGSREGAPAEVTI